MVDREFDSQYAGDVNGKDLAKTYLRGIKEGEEADLAAKELNYAMEGAGTDEEMVKAALQGKSKAEVKKIKDAYKKKTGRELESDVAGDMGGMDEHEVKKSMLGTPESPEDYAKLLEMDRQYQRGAAGSGFMDLMGATGYYGAAEQFDHQHNRTKAALETWSGSGEIDKATGKKGPVKKEGKAFETFQKQQGYFNDDFDSYEKSKSSVADALADGITIVGGALATALSGGAALPFILAGVGLLAAGTKMAIKGNSYDIVENGMADLGKIGIDIITAGWGDKFLPAFKWGAKGVSLAEPVLAKGFTETMKQMSGEYLKKTFVDGLGKNVFKMVAETAMDAESWENDKFFSNLGGKALSHVDPRKFMAEKLVGDNVKKWTGAENTTSIIGTGFKSTVVNLSQGLAEDAMKVESYSDFGNEAWMKEKGKTLTTDMLTETAKANARSKNLAYSVAATDVKTDKDATKLANKLVADTEHFTPKEKTKLYEQLKSQNKEHMVPEHWKGDKSDEVKVKKPEENTKGKQGGVYAAPDQEVVKLNQMKAADLQANFGLDESKAKLIEKHLKDNKVTSVADLETIKGVGPGTTKLIRQQMNESRAVDPKLSKINHVDDKVLRDAGIDEAKIKLIRDHIAKNGPIQSASDLDKIKGIGKGTVATLTKAMSVERVDKVTNKVLAGAGLTDAQAKVVQEHITKVGPIKTAEDLKKIKGLDDATRAKLAAALRV
jgi:DNA uptake protein ComE-like DNA-binding protein